MHLDDYSSINSFGLFAISSDVEIRPAGWFWVKGLRSEESEYLLKAITPA